MPGMTITTPVSPARSWLDRALSLFTDVRAGEGVTAALMLANIFLLLICYSVIKTVREPLILLGGGAEVRSYAAAGQALLLMGFVPLYGWFASRVDRGRLLVGVTLFFIACIELFALAVMGRMPYVGVAFFVWVGIFNMSLVATFWSFANDIYSKEAGDRLFPIVMIGMTAGAPLGSFAASRLFRLGLTPQVILQVSALLLAVSAGLYLAINRRETARVARPVEPLQAGSGFALVLGNRYLLLIAALVVLLNVVNTTGEYMIAKLLTSHVSALAAADPTFDKQAFIGAFSGQYQFWVNVGAFLLQAFATSRLVKYAGMTGALLALPLIALGGYAIIAAGAGFAAVRWIKTAENATDYSIMNTARQMLWLPTSREEKYKAKQAIDTFFVRGGDVLSAVAVFAGTSVLHLTVQQFATVNVALTLIWLALALLIVKPFSMRRMSSPRLATAGAVAAAMLIVHVAPASAQGTREEALAAERAQKATKLQSYAPDPLERRLNLVNAMLMSDKPVYLVMGGPLEGSGLAFGPGYRARYGDTGRFDAHATFSVRNHKEAGATVTLPALGQDRLVVALNGNWFDAPNVAFFGVGMDSSRDARTGFLYNSSSVGATARLNASKAVAFEASVDALRTSVTNNAAAAALDPTYRRTSVMAEIDTRTSPGYTKHGSLVRVEVSDYSQAGASGQSFRRLDAEVQHFVPFLRENWVLAFRALASTTDATDGNQVPYFLMPELGGSRNLRGFSAMRFRDRNRMLLTGEYRWSAGPLVDMALFVDAGKVAATVSDLNFDKLQVAHGIGFRVHTPAATVTRIELARGSEGMRLVFSFSPSF